MFVYPSLISLMVSVDVKHHVYLLTYVCFTVHNKLSVVSADIKQHDFALECELFEQNWSCCLVCKRALAVLFRRLHEQGPAV